VGEGERFLSSYSTIGFPLGGVFVNNSGGGRLLSFLGGIERLPYSDFEDLKVGAMDGEGVGTRVRDTGYVFSSTSTVGIGGGERY